MPAVPPPKRHPYNQWSPDARALDLVGDGLLTRQRYREVPPRVDYELTERAREVLPVVGALSRWGYDWAWGPPRPGEAIDIGAILRASTGVSVPARTKTGKVEI